MSDTLTPTYIRPPARATLRVGMIGMGAIARDHLRSIAKQQAGVKVVGICDVADQSLGLSRAAAPDLLDGAKNYHDYQSLLSDQSPDAVIICSRHCDHYEQVLASLEAGSHVLVEKPLVNSSQQAEQIVSRAKAAGVTVGIAYQRHTVSHFRYVHDAIRRGLFGAVKSISAYQQEGWLEATRGTWRHQPEISGGGYLHDGGSHLLDLALWTSGLMPTHVSAMQDNAGAEVDVSTVITARYANGVFGTMAVTGNVPGWTQRLTIGCEKATICYGDDSGLTVQYPDKKLVRVPADEMPADTDVITNFFDAIHGRAEIAASLECGVNVMRLTEAVQASAARNGCAVTV